MWLCLRAEPADPSPLRSLVMHMTACADAAPAPPAA
jgi:hypothetical protein